MCDINSFDLTEGLDKPSISHNFCYILGNTPWGLLYVQLAQNE